MADLQYNYCEINRYTCRTYWAFVFTTDETVADIVISIMPVLALYVIMDGVQTALTVSLIICIYMCVILHIYIVYICMNISVYHDEIVADIVISICLS
jgi:hypothetical protein